MYNNNILHFQESTTILKLEQKKAGNLFNAPRTSCVHTDIFYYAVQYLLFCVKGSIG